MTGKALKKVDESHDQVTLPAKAIDGDQAPVKFDPPALETFENDRALTPIGEGRDQAPVPLPPPSPCLDVFERYSSDLICMEYDDIDDSGKPVAKQWPLERIRPSTKLIPKSDCLAIIDELEAALITANYESARVLTDTLVGRDTGTKFNNVEIFVAETTNLFSKYPADIGWRAVELLVKFKYGVPKVGDISAAADPLLEKRRGALRQVRAHLAEHQRRDGKPAPAGELSEKISWFKGLAPALKAAIGEAQFQIFWEPLWLVSDHGGRMVLAQPTRLLRDLTAPHLAAIGKVADREVELVVKQKPASGSRKSADGPRPIGDVMAGE